MFKKSTPTPEDQPRVVSPSEGTSNQFARDIEKVRLRDEVRLVESVLRQHKRRHRVRKAFEKTSTQTQLEQLQRNLEPATHPRAPMFYTEETERSGHR